MSLPSRNLTAADLFSGSELKIIIGVSRHDNPRDVDEAYGAGTYDHLFPEPEESDGPDPYDELIEREMELKRHIAPFHANEGDDYGDSD